MYTIAIVDTTIPSTYYPNAATVVYTLSLHDALPIYCVDPFGQAQAHHHSFGRLFRCGEYPLLANAVAVRLHSREPVFGLRSEEHTSELQSRPHLVCGLLLEKKKMTTLNGLNTHQIG